MTANSDSIASVEGVELFIVNRAGLRDRGPHRQAAPSHVPRVSGDPIRGYHDLLRQKTPSLFIL
jgi:hypothetical protein